MKKYDDAKIDALLKESAEKKEKLDSLTKERLYAKIDGEEITQCKKQERHIFRYAAAAILFIGLIAVAVYMYGRSDKKSETIDSDVKVADGSDTEVKESIDDYGKIEQPVYLKAMKYDWYNAEKAKSFVYDKKEKDGIYIELTLDSENECLYFDVTNHSSSYGCDYDYKKMEHRYNDYDRKKLSVYRSFYEGAIETFVFQNYEYKELLLEKYEEMYEFAADYPTYLREGIRLAIEDIKADKRYVFCEDPVNINGEYSGWHIFRADLSNAEFERMEDPTIANRILYSCELEAKSIYDEKVRTRMKVIKWIWEEPDKEEKDCYSYYSSEIPSEYKCYVEDDSFRANAYYEE